MNALLDAILRDDQNQISALLRGEPALAMARVAQARLIKTPFTHWLYVDDTALHLAAAGYRVASIAHLLDAGADPNACTNMRRSTPLHYAADGIVGDAGWQPARQVAAIRALCAAGAQINAQDKNGATPLHRATRTRCADAVQSLLALGADPLARNKAGSMPFHLAVQNTGRGGSGSAQAQAQQRAIITAFLAAGLSSAVTDGSGKTVIECAQQRWVRALLEC
jgi:ankyrin repeat protein